MSLVEQVHVEPEEPLSESKPKAQLEHSASHTCALGKSKSKMQLELSAAGRAEQVLA